MTIGIGKDGALFTDRFHGWYRTSTASLKGNLESGCYNDSHPTNVTSVRLVIADGAAKPRVESLFVLLQKEGWPREKIQTQPWKEYP